MPDLRGRWIGEQRSSYVKGGKNVTSRVVLEITQTFDAISANTYYKRWQTSHCDANVMRLDGKPYLVLLFESEPNSLHSGYDGAQNGVTRLYYVPNDKKLIGHYFNSNGNHGEVVLTRHSFNLRQAFE